MSTMILTLMLVLLALCLVFLVVVGIFLVTGLFTVPWVRTSRLIAHEMLEMGGFLPGDHVLDVGSGDGTIVFEAVRMGGTGEGIERMRMLIWYARLQAAMKRVASKTQFHRANIFTTAFPPAKIVTCYLFSEVNTRLEPRLKDAFAPGTKVVSRDFTFPTLALLGKKSIGSTTLYVYEL